MLNFSDLDEDLTRFRLLDLKEKLGFLLIFPSKTQKLIVLIICFNFQNLFDFCSTLMLDFEFVRKALCCVQCKSKFLMDTSIISNTIQKQILQFDLCLLSKLKGHHNHIFLYQ